MSPHLASLAQHTSRVCSATSVRACGEVTGPQRIMPVAKSLTCGASTHFIAASLLSICQLSKQHLMSTSRHQRQYMRTCKITGAAHVAKMWLPMAIE